MKDYSGRKYNYLTLLTYEESGGAGVGTYWLARCDCGTVKKLLARDVVHGRVKSCGKCEYTRRLMDGRKSDNSKQKVAERALMGRYVTAASDQGVDWQLTPEDFQRITKSNCLLCGEMPRTRWKKSSIIYNTLSRIDLQGAYTLDNCMPCCPDCRLMRMNRKIEDFLGKVSQIAEHVKLVINS